MVVMWHLRVEGVQVFGRRVMDSMLEQKKVILHFGSGGQSGDPNTKLSAIGLAVH